MTTAASSTMPPSIDLQHRADQAVELAAEARHSLRLWRWVYYGVGLLAVATAAAAGASSLGTLFGAKAGGVLALVAAVLGAIDKSLGAADRVSRLDRRYQGLAGLRDEFRNVVADAKASEAAHQPASADYHSWALERRNWYDATLAAIDGRQDRR